MDLAPALARLAQFLGALSLFGVPLFCLYGLRGSQGSALSARIWPRRFYAVGALLVLVGGIVGLGLETANMTGQPADAWRWSAISSVALGTRFGQGMIVRLSLTALILPLTVVSPSPSQRRLLACLSAPILASFAFTGHGAADDGWAGWLHLWADIVHLLAAGLWLGALAALSRCLFEPSTGEGAASLCDALTRFSGVGSAVVALLLLTGLINGWFLVGPSRLTALWTTLYGQLLILKLFLFGLMVGLAAHNRFNLTPKLKHRLYEAPETLLGALTASVGAESLLGLAVVAAVAVLGVLPPASMS